MKKYILALAIPVLAFSCKSDTVTETGVADKIVANSGNKAPAKETAAPQPASDFKSVNGGTALSDEQKAERKNKQLAAQGFDTRVPDACTLVSPSTIAALVGADKGAIEIKDGSTSNSKHSRSCFFKWDDPGMSNAGVMVQVMTNPVVDDVPDYLTLFIDSKKTQGEQAFNSKETYLYKDFQGFGDDGAASFDMHKYLWRTGDQFAYMIAFNTTLNERQELAAARKIAAEVMQNFN